MRKIFRTFFFVLPPASTWCRRIFHSTQFNFINFLLTELDGNFSLFFLSLFKRGNFSSLFFEIFLYLLLHLNLSGILEEFFFTIQWVWSLLNVEKKLRIILKCFSAFKWKKVKEINSWPRNVKIHSEIYEKIKGIWFLNFHLEGVLFVGDLDKDTGVGRSADEDVLRLIFIIRFWIDFKFNLWIFF